MLNEDHRLRKSKTSSEGVDKESVGAWEPSLKGEVTLERRERIRD